MEEGKGGELAGWQSPVSIVKSFIILPLGEKKPISIPINLKFLTTFLNFSKLISSLKAQVCNIFKNIEITKFFY